MKYNNFAPWPYYDDEERQAVTDLLASGKVNYWTGNEGIEFEKNFAKYSNRRFAIALFNGTVALELALLAYNIGPGDEVIVTSRSFFASASSVLTRGAVPVFADVDLDNQNIFADSIKEKITPRTKAIMCVHLSGWSCDMDPITKLAKEHSLIVIEDCAQAHGAKYKGRPVGSLGDIAAFSFCQDKIMSTGGEGGILLTDDENIYKKCWAYKDHGKDYDLTYNTEHAPGFRWLHTSVGTNWRMTGMQTLIGTLQLKKLDFWVERRRAIAASYSRAFSKIPALRLTVPSSDCYHSYYKYYMFIRPENLKPDWTRDRIMVAINNLGVPCFSGSCSEIYLEKAFALFYEEIKKKKPYPDSQILDSDNFLPNARALGETSLMLLCHPTLTEQNVKDTISAIEEIFSEATK